MGSGGFLTRFFLGFAVILAAGTLAVGCAAEKPQGEVLGAGVEDGSWATRAELVWVGKLGAWNTRLVRGLQTAASIETNPRLVKLLGRRDGATMYRHEQALRPAVSCESDLMTQVGVAPTDRLAHALDIFRRACTQLERFSSAVTFAVYRHKDSEFRQAREAASQARTLLDQADELLPPGEVRGLPVVGGNSSSSRIEPRFSKVASELAGKDVEVRCWSLADWRHLMREERAYTQGKLHQDLLGFAGIGDDRINLAPEACEGLVDLTYNKSRPSDPANVLLLAASVVVLAHEPQHSKGIANEAVAECAAIHAAERTALRLGVRRAYARLLVQTYWQHYDEEPAAYRTPDCRRP